MDSTHQQLIDVGDRVVCVHVRGRGPTVVLEAAGGGEGTTGAYRDVGERLASFVTVLTYDRAGSGRSDGPAHRHVADMADDLNAVIQATGCTAPVVIVGWSMGGLVAELFAVEHPAMVAGLVLVDPIEMPTRSRRGRCRLQILGVGQILITSLAVKLGLFRTRVGRNLLRRKCISAGMSAAGLDYVENFMVNPPRARWSFAPVLPLFFGGYARETATALRVAALPDVPVRVLVPHGRGSFSRAGMQRLDVAHLALAQRFHEENLSPWTGPVTICRSNDRT